MSAIRSRAQFDVGRGTIRYHRVSSVLSTVIETHSLRVTSFTLAKLYVCEEKVWVKVVVLRWSVCVCTVSKPLWVGCRKNTRELIFRLTSDVEPCFCVALAIFLPLPYDFLNLNQLHIGYLHVHTTQV